MDSDSYQNLNKWKNYELILSNYSIIVYNRPNYETNAQKKGIFVQNAPLLDISSTLIRNNIKQGKSIKYLVADVVFEELMNNKYYK